VLVLETLEHAIERGAPIIAEIIAFAETFDAFSMMSISPGGKQIEAMLDDVLRKAQLSSQDIQYINAHGTGTQVNDREEADVIRRKFGSSVLVNSTKSLTGHTIGASGALEAITTALTLHHSIAHPSKNLDDPICDLNFATSAQTIDTKYALTQSFAFGGHNAALVLGRYDD
tara:strand:- start:595 stop:1110 length:516 start_codon:yes stop_codon:yes gene_type:complete